MTKARDTANLIATGVPNSLITLDAAEIPNISTDKLTTGTLANARVADLDTAKITTGTMANARISAGSVTQHVTATDLQPIKSDISALALREATNEASAAFNLPNQFIDTFASDVLGSKTLTTVTGGYVALTTGTFASSQYTRQIMTGLATAGGSVAGLVLSDNPAAIVRTYNATASGTTDVEAYEPFQYTTGSSVAGYAIADLGATYSITQMIIGKGRGYGDPRSILMKYHATATDPQASGTVIDFTDAVSAVYSYKNSNPNLSNFTSSGTADWAALTTNADGVACKINGFTPFTARYISYKFQSADFHDANAGWSEFDIYKDGRGLPNTGNIIQAANTVGSAKTKVGGTMLYKDLHGTATLGTDLKIYFSCNNGGAWTEAASYNAITPVYSTGIKQVRLGETTCTSGTGVIYKAVWANQSVGVKETQLHGIGINY